jgi:hypothetical protein
LPVLEVELRALPQDLFCPLFSDFVEEKRRKEKEKKITFCLFKIKIATQGVSL